MDQEVGGSIPPPSIAYFPEIDTTMTAQPDGKQKKIKPEVLKGFRDYPPSEEIARQKLVSVFREVFESFGFSPLQTPPLEKI